MGEIPLEEMLCRCYWDELDQVAGKGSLGGDEQGHDGISHPYRSIRDKLYVLLSRRPTHYKQESNTCGSIFRNCCANIFPDYFGRKKQINYLERPRHKQKNVKILASANPNLRR
jgi:hypothetical protein